MKTHQLNNKNSILFQCETICSRTLAISHNFKIEVKDIILNWDHDGLLHKWKLDKTVMPQNIQFDEDKVILHLFIYPSTYLLITRYLLNGRFWVLMQTRVYIS